MTEPINMEGKGLTVEVWTTAKGEKQYRIKANPSILEGDTENMHIMKVDTLVMGAIQILRARFDIEVK
jgi:hypothetical protein